jgi:hypothetical protein
LSSAVSTAAQSKPAMCIDKAGMTLSLPLWGVRRCAR